MNKIVILDAYVACNGGIFLDGLEKLGNLVVFSNERLDRADTDEVFLRRLVHIVVLVEHFLKWNS